MKTIFLIIATFGSFSVFSQQTAEWIGGTPGVESEWFIPSNWNTNRVPDEDTKVVIRGTHSGHLAMPVIWQEAEALQIDIISGGSLTILETGSLSIDGESFYTKGICVFGGELKNFGLIELIHLESNLTGRLGEYSLQEGKVREMNALVSIVQ